MINAYGWQIQETGELGKGAKFVITIPKMNKNGEENYRIIPQPGLQNLQKQVID
jgi:hypothetical protein